MDQRRLLFCLLGAIALWALALGSDRWGQSPLRQRIQPWGSLVLAGVLGLVFTFSLLSPVLAAPAPEQPSLSGAESTRTPANQPDTGDIPSETVSQFVSAYLAVVDLIEQREPDLQRAETESESVQVQREVQAQAFQLIQAAGLTRQQYWQLLGLANTDADFRERVLAQVEEASLSQ